MFLFSNKLKIAETYIKLDTNFDSESILKVDSTIKKLALENRRKFKDFENISIVIEYEKGSLKVKILVFGTLLLQGIVQYGEIREGIDYLYNDAKWFSEQIIQQSKQENNFIDDSFTRSERRTGLIGRLKRTLDRIEYLENNLDNIGNNQVHQELTELRSDLVSMIALLDFQQQQTFLEALPVELRDNLPEENPEKTQHFLNLYAMKPEDVQIEDEN